MSAMQFARMPDGREIGYRWLHRGDGPVLVHPPGGMIPIEVVEEDPPYERFLRRMGQYGGVVVFDFPGKGSSDPLDPEADFYDEVAAAFVAVLDAEETDAAWFVGAAAMGAPMALRLSSAYPKRLLGNAIINPPQGDASVEVDVLLDRESKNGGGIGRVSPSRRNDPTFLAWGERAGRIGGSAAAARLVWDAVKRSTPRLLSGSDRLVGPPPSTLLIRRREACSDEAFRWWRHRFGDPSVVEIDGTDIGFQQLDSVLIADEMGEFITGVKIAKSGEDRSLVALLFLDLVSSTEHVRDAGDGPWRATLDQFEEAVEMVVERYGGIVVKHLGDGTLARFPTGSRAAAAAGSIRRELSDQQLEARFGLHVGEVEERGDDVGGIAVHLAARVMGEAGAGEILATSTVVESIVGSSAVFVEVGERQLKGFEHPWAIFALQGA